MIYNFILYHLIFIIVIYHGNSDSLDIVRFHPADIRWSMAMSQSSVDDWKQGKVNQFEFSSAMDLRKNVNFDTLLFRYHFYYAVGTLFKDDKKNGIDYTIPTDNRYGMEGVLVYPIGWKLDPFFSATFNTQITISFMMLNNKRKATAKHWDPVTSQQSWGFEYSYRDGTDYMLSRIGFSLKQIRSYRYTKLSDDIKTPDIKERYKAESGILWKTESSLQLNPTLDYKGGLDLFGTFDDLTKWSVIFRNEFKIKVWEFVAIIIKLDLVYDEKQAMYLQYNQGLRFGIVMDLK